MTSTENPTGQTRILVIDDDPSILELIQLGLANEGFRIEEAENATTARELLEDNDYDLVLCDWMLPDVAGDALLAWAKQDERLAAIPFIMISAREEKPYVVKAFRLGADGYIVKPFTIERLRHKINGVLKRKVPGVRACNAVIHFHNISIKGAIASQKDECLAILAEKSGPLPRLFEAVVVNLERDGRINPHAMRGTVVALVAEGLEAKSARLEVTVRLQGLSDEERENLTRVRCLSREEG